MKNLMHPSFNWFGLFSFILVSLIGGNFQQPTPTPEQREIRRDIISEDFVKNRPAKKSGKGLKKSKRSDRSTTTQADKLQIGVTIWKLEPLTAGLNRREWISRRVDADAQFKEGDTLRLSIESDRAGYLYVINRDRLADGSVGETNLIFPTQGEDNRLEAGKLIDIPGQGEVPFKASPKPNQSGELLTFIVTSSPLSLPLSNRPLPISKKQLTEWEEKWGTEADRRETNGGAGKTRTEVEQLAASPFSTRQLTREDPPPQTVYYLVPKDNNAVLFNIVLSYVR